MSGYPRLEVLPLAKLRPHPNGCRESDPESLYRLQLSYERFGLLQPPVFNARLGHLVGGNALLTVLKAKGVKEVACWCVDVPVEEHLEPVGVGVIVRSRHFCMACRGVRQSETEMVTSSMLGAMRTDPTARAEFLRLAQ